MNTKLRNSPEARDVIRSAYQGGRNFMTPDLIGCYLIRNGALAVELSTGEGIPDRRTGRGAPLYGVTVVHRRTCRPMHDKSECFHDRERAESYIRDLDASCVEIIAPEA